MPSAVYALLRQAIIERKHVVCLYQEHVREVCPHCIGMKGGREKVLSFQFAGGSSSGLPPGGQWRCMFIDEISNASARDGDWHTSTGHSRPQTCVDQVDVEVPF